MRTATPASATAQPESVDAEGRSHRWGPVAARHTTHRRQRRMRRSPPNLPSLLSREPTGARENPSTAGASANHPQARGATKIAMPVRGIALLICAYATARGRRIHQSTTPHITNRLQRTTRPTTAPITRPTTAPGITAPTTPPGPARLSRRSSTAARKHQQARPTGGSQRLPTASAPR